MSDISPSLHAEIVLCAGNRCETADCRNSVKRRRFTLTM